MKKAADAATIVSAVLAIVTFLAGKSWPAPAGSGSWPVLALCAAVFASAVLNLVASHVKPKSPATPRPNALPEADPAADAPRLLINYTRENMGRITFINDGPGTIVSPRLGPLRWCESRTLDFVGSAGMIPPHGQSEHLALFEEAPRQGSELYHFMRQSTPHDAETTVDVTYEDGSGRKFVRRFTLKSEIDGKVTWMPGPVRFVS